MLAKVLLTPTICLIVFAWLSWGYSAGEFLTRTKRAAEPASQIFPNKVTPLNGQDIADASSQTASKDVQTAAETDPDRIARLSQYLTGTRWTGQFTVVGQDTKPPAPEQYEIKEATKADEGDYWNLVVRIKYGENDTTLALPPIEIKWAGETPVITVDRVTIPLMGTFDARVLIRRGQYAGTWSHDDVGGHLFGIIEKMDSAEADKERTSDDKAP